MKINTRTVLSLTALTLLAASCGDSADNNATGTTMGELTLSSADLPALGAASVYEGWLIVDGAPVSTGRFSAAADGGIEQAFELDRATLDAATKFILTIEPAEGDDPAPSDIHLVAGDLVDGLADAVISDAAALNTDFSSASGGYILAAPSADAGMGDYNNGIWFLDPAAGPASSLDLPELPAGWAYEGWVVTDDGPVSTGRFTDLGAEDSDGAGPAAGPNPGPPFPGQDYVADGSLIDIVGKTVVISVEPEPDDSPAPFALKPLIDEAAEDVGAMVLQDFANTASGPTVSVDLN